MNKSQVPPDAVLKDLFGFAVQGLHQLPLGGVLEPDVQGQLEVVAGSPLLQTLQTNLALGRIALELGRGEVLLSERWLAEGSAGADGPLFDAVLTAVDPERVVAGHLSRGDLLSRLGSRSRWIAVGKAAAAMRRSSEMPKQWHTSAWMTSASCPSSTGR